ncbi:MAG: YwaF family protein, partial [Acetatifactor sp.]|nr:YwaF family protein [Acetatifactor sp.]
FKKKRPNLDRVLTTALIIAVLSEAAKMMGVIKLVPSQNGELMLPYLPMNHLPLHFCSIQIILIAAARFMKGEKQRETLLAFMAPTCTLGGIMALLMPSIFTTTVSVEQAFTSVISYQFFIFHTMIIALGLIIANSGQIDWSIKHFKNTVLLVYLLGILSIYLNSMLASPTYKDGKLISVDFWTNFFFTYQNPLGIQITQLWQWYLYLLIIMLLATLLLYLFYLPLIRKNNRTK